MAVQKNRMTPSKRGMRRSHDHLINNTALTEDKETGDVHRRHHVNQSGSYRGRKIVDTDFVAG